MGAEQSVTLAVGAASVAGVGAPAVMIGVGVLVFLVAGGLVIYKMASTSNPSNYNCTM